jgi:hypothetical protein
MMTVGFFAVYMRMLWVHMFVASVWWSAVVFFLVLQLHFVVVLFVAFACFFVFVV